MSNTRNQLILWILGIHFLALLISCHPKDELAISSKDLQYLKDTYNIETLNYFYETVFSEDDKKEKRDVITKWNSNPTIAIIGDPDEEEIGYVNRAISEINELNLPIKLSLTAASDSASRKIFFGDLEEVCDFLKLDSLSVSEMDPGRHFGQGISVAYDGTIVKDSVGIYLPENDLDHSMRYKVVLEELVQGLGIVGDSYNYPSSLFFQNNNPSKSFRPLDVAVLTLLYEPVIPANYTRESFEKNFADELYAVNSRQKLKELLKQNPQTSFDDIEKCFSGDVFLKRPKETDLYLYGAIGKEDTFTIERVLLALNKLSPNLNIRIVESPIIEPDHGIVLIFHQSDDQKESIQGRNQVIAGTSCMYPKLIKSKLELYFNSSERAQELRQQSIIDAICFSVVQLPRQLVHTEQLYEISETGIEFTPRYASLLKLVYSNEFIDGFHLDDFNQIRLSMNR